MTLIFTFMCILATVAMVPAEDNYPQIRTSSVTVIGKMNSELPVMEFLGVPYAEAPIGKLRFQAPVPLSNQDKIIKANKFAPSCIQPLHIKSAINPLLRYNATTISEDCLYMNLYVPVSDQDELFPVMVWLAGEGFGYADPSQFDGSYLAATGKMIVVTVNYRVSVFGFLNALNNEAPGNVGLWDQRLALKWIQENIGAFGGNPEKVTLSGRFSGAMSAAIHAFSPLSLQERLFQRVILHSGIPDGKWIFDSTPLNSVTELAELTDCVFDNFTTTILCLKNLPAEKLLQAALPIQNNWRPSLDFNLINETAIDKIIKGSYSPVDLIVFTNKDEGSLCLTALNVLNPKLYQSIIEDKLSKEEFEGLVSSFLLDVYKEANNFVNNLVSFEYIENSPGNLKDAFVRFCGDLYVTAISGKLANGLAERRQNVFVAELTHRPYFSNQPSFINAGHGDDVIYSLGLPLQLENLPSEEKELTRRIIRTISNFAYHGNPNNGSRTHWPVYTSDKKLVMRFGTDLLRDEVKECGYENTVEFWDTIVPAAFHNNCPPSPITAALREAEGNAFLHPAHVAFLGTWVSVPAAEYIMTGLLTLNCVLLISVFISLIVIYRQTSRTTFQRLK